MTEGTLPSNDHRFGGRYDTRVITQPVSGLEAHRIIVITGNEDGDLLGGNPSLDIPQGNVTGVSSVNKFGYNADIQAAADEDIWTGGGIWVAPTQARIHQIASTDAADTSAGAGAKTVRVYGLTDWDTAEVNEDITMDGETDVPTSNAYVIIHRMKVLTAGTSGPNAGAITATADTDATVTARIEISDGQTLMAIYGVPSTQNFYMTNAVVGIQKTTAGSVDCRLLVNQEPGDNATTFLCKQVLSVSSTGLTTLVRRFEPYFRFDGPCIIKLKVGASANNTGVDGGFDGILVTE